LGFRWADRRLSRALADASHGLDGIDSQIQQNLLRLDLIALNEWRTIREVRSRLRY
jgi:hypothetical protein